MQTSTLAEEQVLERFRSIRSWVHGDHRAPHKSLLLLLALAALQRDDRWLSYAAVEPQLRRLLADFGPDRRSLHPEYPFWRLRNDGLWEFQNEAALIDALTSSGDVPSSALRAIDAKAGFTEPFFRTLRSQPSLVNAAAEILLEQCFPESLYQTILDAVDFQWVVIARGRRDPQFRIEILRIYEHRCAVCGFDARLGNTDLGLEAAHVKWHAAGGPDTANNGVALCSFHHLAFDRGALSIDERLRILISKDVHGQNHVEQLLLVYSGKSLRPPQRGEPVPEHNFLDWHRREVFWAPARSFETERIE